MSSHCPAAPPLVPRDHVKGPAIRNEAYTGLSLSSPRFSGMKEAGCIRLVSPQTLVLFGSVVVTKKCSWTRGPDVLELGVC